MLRKDRLGEGRGQLCEREGRGPLQHHGAAPRLRVVLVDEEAALSARACQVMGGIRGLG